MDFFLRRTYRKNLKYQSCAHLAIPAGVIFKLKHNWIYPCFLPKQCQLKISLAFCSFLVVGGKEKKSEELRWYIISNQPIESCFKLERPCTQVNN